MKKYWIIENGKPIGPFSSSELRSRSDFKADLPVWYAELKDWTTVSELAELSCLLESETPAEAGGSTPPEIPTVEAQSTSAWISPSAQAVRVTIEQSRRPRTYIGWCIALLICCCTPCGVAGLILGSMVNRCWMRGETDKARRYSEYVEWCIIIGIVVGLVMIPFQLVFMM